MLAKLIQHSGIITETELAQASHVLYVLPEKAPQGLPGMAMLQAGLKRRREKYQSLGKTPLTMDMPSGGLVTWVALDQALSTFERHTRLRKAVVKLLEEQPQALTIVVAGDDEQRKLAAQSAIYVAWLNSALLPVRKNRRRNGP